MTKKNDELAALVGQATQEYLGNNAPSQTIQPETKDATKSEDKKTPKKTKK